MLLHKEGVAKSGNVTYRGNDLKISVLLKDSYLNIDTLRKRLFIWLVCSVRNQNTQTFKTQLYRKRKLPLNFHKYS